MLKDLAQEYQRRGVVLCFVHGMDDVLSKSEPNNALGPCPAR